MVVCPNGDLLATWCSTNTEPGATSGGAIAVPCDAVPGAQGGTALWITRDRGAIWEDAGTGNPVIRSTTYNTTATGGSIAGIHAGVVELKDGGLLAFGRQDSIDGRMPMSESADGGRTWSYRASEFPPIEGGQRLALRRLGDGSLMLASFTSDAGMMFRAADGTAFRGYGLFVALSVDDGRTWRVRKLITPGPGPTTAARGPRPFKPMQPTPSPRGYLTATQTPDGVIHLLSSALEYEFNVAWLKDGRTTTRP